MRIQMHIIPTYFPRSSAPVNSVVRSSIPTMSDIKKRLFKRGIFNETSGIRTPDNLIKSQVLYHLS